MAVERVQEWNHCEFDEKLAVKSFGVDVCGVEMGGDLDQFEETSSDPFCALVDTANDVTDRRLTRAMLEYRIDRGLIVLVQDWNSSVRVLPQFG